MVKLVFGANSKGKPQSKGSFCRRNNCKNANSGKQHSWQQELHSVTSTPLSALAFYGYYRLNFMEDYEDNRVLEKRFRKSRSAAMLSPPHPQESSAEVVQISNCSFQCWSQEPDRLGWRSIETKDGQHGTFWNAGASTESEGGETPEPNTCIRTRALSPLSSASPLGCRYQPPSSVVRPGCRTAWVNSSCHILRYWHTISLQPCPQQLNLGSLPVSIARVKQEPPGGESEHPK